MVSPLQPLSVDCSLEYELDVSMFPGWDDPMVRALPSLMLHRPDSCDCQTVPHATLENYDDEVDYSIATAGLCQIFNDLPYEVNSSHQSPVKSLSRNGNLTDLMCDPYLIAPTSPSPLSFVCISSTLSSHISAASSLRDIDFLLLSPVDTAHQPTLYRKRKHDDEFKDSSAAKRLCNYGDELFNELNVSFNTNTVAKELDTVNEMGYDFNAPERD